jgi:hypothetical protein
VLGGGGLHIGKFPVTVLSFPVSFPVRIPVFCMRRERVVWAVTILFRSCLTDRDKDSRSFPKYAGHSRSMPVIPGVCRFSIKTGKLCGGVHRLPDPPLPTIS